MYPSTTSATYSHHPFAHTATPVTPSSNYSATSIADTVSALTTSLKDGMSSAKVPAVREMTGANEFEVGAKDPAWRKFLAQFYESPLIPLLLASAVVSAFVGNYDDAVSIICAVLIVVTGESHTQSPLLARKR